MTCTYTCCMHEPDISNERSVIFTVLCVRAINREYSEIFIMNSRQGCIQLKNINKNQKKSATH
jgi:hypothetical protein